MRRPFVMVAPTGARLGRSDHPALPLGLPEIVAETRACRAAGADALHLHLRDAAGGHSLDPGLCQEALAELDRQFPGFPVQVTTEAAGRFDVAAQLHLVATLRPRWISLSIREMARDKPRAARLYAAIHETGGRVQHILNGPEDVAALAAWRADGTIPEAPLEVIHVLGRYATGTPSDPAQVAPRLAPLTGAARQMLCAFGPSEHACLVEAARLGADVRVGFENSLCGAEGRPWASNAASVAALRASLAQADRIAS